MPKSPSCRFPRHIGRRDATWSFLRYQIVAGYEDANDADRLRHDPLRPDAGLDNGADRRRAGEVDRRRW